MVRILNHQINSQLSFCIHNEVDVACVSFHVLSSQAGVYECRVQFLVFAVVVQCWAVLAQVSIIRDIKHREIRIMTDAGRTSRPLLIVEEQKLLLKKSHIDLLKEKEFNQYGSASSSAFTLSLLSVSYPCRGLLTMFSYLCSSSCNSNI